jgi:hypothetical protein
MHESHALGIDRERSTPGVGYACNAVAAVHAVFRVAHQGSSKAAAFAVRGDRRSLCAGAVQLIAALLEGGGLDDGEHLHGAHLRVNDGREEAQLLLRGHVLQDPQRVCVHLHAVVPLGSFPKDPQRLDASGGGGGGEAEELVVGSVAVGGGLEGELQRRQDRGLVPCNSSSMNPQPRCIHPQLCHVNGVGSINSFAGRLLFGFLPYFLAFSLKTSQSKDEIIRALK